MEGRQEWREHLEVSGERDVSMELKKAAEVTAHPALIPIAFLQCRAGPWSEPAWASTKVEPYPEAKASGDWYHTIVS